MGFFDKLFGKKPAQAPKPEATVSRQLPSSMVAEEFGEVNIREMGDAVEVTLTIRMEPQGVEAEGWQTGVALDASSSMTDWYGQGLRGAVPESVKGEYIKKNWIRLGEADGRRVAYWQPEAYDDAIRKGYMRMTENIVEPIARNFTAYLAEGLDEDGGTTVIYWACGNGRAFEIVGDLTSGQCRTQEFKGPKDEKFGDGTYLLPAMQYFLDRFQDARRGMYLFITDGRIDDLDPVKEYTRDLCRRIDVGMRNPVKCVLIGVGEQIDERQMEELDDLDTGTPVDVWDHKIAREMRDLNEIFAEVVSENQIIAPEGRILDDQGNGVSAFPNGLPAKITFTMPASSQAFELVVGGRSVRQAIR